MSALGFHEPVLMTPGATIYRVLDFQGRQLDIPVPEWAVFVSWGLRGDRVEFRASDGGLDWQVFGPAVKVLP